MSQETRGDGARHEANAAGGHCSLARRSGAAPPAQPQLSPTALSSHLFEVHRLHCRVHGLDDALHAARHLPHGHGGLHALRNRVDARRHPQKLRLLVLVADGVLCVDARVLGQALFHRLRRDGGGWGWGERQRRSACSWRRETQVLVLVHKGKESEGRCGSLSPLLWLDGWPLAFTAANGAVASGSNIKGGAKGARLVEKRNSERAAQSVSFSFHSR